MKKQIIRGVRYITMVMSLVGGLAAPLWADAEMIVHPVEPTSYDATGTLLVAETSNAKPEGSESAPEGKIHERAIGGGLGGGGLSFTCETTPTETNCSCEGVPDCQNMDRKKCTASDGRSTMKCPPQSSSCTCKSAVRRTAPKPPQNPLPRPKVFERQ